MKVTTPKERTNVKRKRRLQKKLHVGEFKQITCMVKFDLNEEFRESLKDDERLFEFFDDMYDITMEIGEDTGCQSISGHTVEILFDHLETKGDLRLQLIDVLKDKFNDGIEGDVTVTDYVDSYYWEEWDSDDPFEILAVTAKAR